jgi:hypothetical protein
MVFENYFIRSKVFASPLLFELLNFFDTWRSASSFERRFPQFDPALLRSGLSVLVRHALLQRSDQPHNPASPRAMAAWANWNPAAGLLHFSTKDLQYSSDLEFLLKRQQKRAKTLPMPAPVKRYPGAKRIALPAPRQGGEFPQVLLARRTWRNFSSRPVELSALSTLLGLSFGVRWWVDVPGLGRLALKTSPSGGSRPPSKPTSWPAAWPTSRQVFIITPRTNTVWSG